MPSSQGARYLVEVSLTAAKFKPGGRFYEKVIHSLDTCLAPAALLCLYERDGNSEYPAPLAAFRPTPTPVQPQHAHPTAGAPTGPPPIAPHTTPSPSRPGDAAANAATAEQAPLPAAGVATAADGRGGGCVGVGVGATPSALSCVAGRVCTGPMQLPQLTRGTLGGRQVSGSGAGSVAGGAGEARRERFASLHEWLGAVSCGVGASSCAGLLPEGLPSLGQGSVHSATWRGFYSSECVRKCAAAAVDAVSRSALPWVVIQVWGFAHSPVCWRGQRRCPGSVCGEGDSHYSLVLMPDADVLCMRSLGEGDVKDAST
ncbi:MAG: hypothetical protein WDW36_001684 [Sanguina aurantia]